MASLRSVLRVASLSLLAGMGLAGCSQPAPESSRRPDGLGHRQPAGGETGHRF